MLQAAIAIHGIIGGPNFAMFCLGAFYPHANKWGAHFGFVIGLICSTVLYVGSKFHPPGPDQIKKLDLWTYR